jgi:hypothetical protein
VTCSACSRGSLSRIVRLLSPSFPAPHSPNDNLRDGVVAVLERDALDELVQFLVELSAFVIQRRQLCIPCHVLDAEGDSASESVEPIVLSKGTLRSDHARHLIAEAVEGSAFPVDGLGAVEVFLDHRRTDHQTMLVHHRLKDVNDSLLVSNGAPVCIFHTRLVGVLMDGADPLGEHPTTVVGLAQNQLDAVLLGYRYKRLQRLIVVAAKEVTAGAEEHPAVQQLKDRIRRLVVPAT